MQVKQENIWKIKTPYGTKNWAYIKKLLDQDNEGNVVEIHVLGGVATVVKCPDHITVKIIDRD